METTFAELTSKTQGERPLFGTMLISGGIEPAELLGNAGMDFVCIDQMITTIGWTQTAQLLRAVARGGASGWVRLSAFPWGDASQAAVLQRDTLRAITGGASAVTASVDSIADAKALLAPFGDRHANVATFTPAPLASIFPLVESREIFDNLDELVSLDGVESVFLGLGDLSGVLGAPFDLDDQVVQGAVRRAVEICSARGVAVQAPVNGKFWQPEVVRKNIDTLIGLGVSAIWLPHPTTALYYYYRSVIDPYRQ